MNLIYVKSNCSAGHYDAEGKWGYVIFGAPSLEALTKQCQDLGYKLLTQT